MYLCMYLQVYVHKKIIQSCMCIYVYKQVRTVRWVSVLQVCKGLKLVGSDTLRTQADRLVCGHAFEILPLSEMNTGAEKT